MQSWPPLKLERPESAQICDLTVSVEWCKLHESPSEKAGSMLSVKKKKVALRINLICTLNRCSFHFKNWHLNFSLWVPSYIRILVYVKIFRGKLSLILLHNIDTWGIARQKAICLIFLINFRLFSLISNKIEYNLHDQEMSFFENF